MILQLSTGIINIAQWYAFNFFHHQPLRDGAIVAAGAVLVHIGVKLPVIRRALGEPLEEVPTGELMPPHRPSRRAVLGGTGLAVGLATILTAGQTIPWLRHVSLLAPRSGQGPQGVPVNRSAWAAGVLRSARSPDYRLTVVNGGNSKAFTVTELAAMPQTTHRPPIACVEGWSATADWTGVVLADLARPSGGRRTPMSG